MFELICKKHSYNGKDGKERVGFNYFIKTDTGIYIAVKPVFDDYQKLRVISKLED